MENKNNLAKALVTFQSKLKPAGKDAVNPFFKSNYLTLSGILDHVMPLLAECGLSITQPYRVDGDRTILGTRLLHESGEFMLSEMIVPSHPDPQKFGSLLTYYRRYQLQALVCVSTNEEDNDGNDLVEPPASRPSNIQPQQQQEKFNPITEKQINLIKSKSEALKLRLPDFATMSTRTGSDYIKNLEQQLEKLTMLKMGVKN